MNSVFLIFILSCSDKVHQFRPLTQFQLFTVCWNRKWGNVNVSLVKSECFRGTSWRSLLYWPQLLFTLQDGEGMTLPASSDWFTLIFFPNHNQSHSSSLNLTNPTNKSREIWSDDHALSQQLLDRLPQNLWFVVSGSTNHTDFCDSLFCLLAPPWGWQLCFFIETHELEWHFFYWHHPACSLHDGVSSHFHFSAIITSKFKFAQFFGLWLNTCQTNSNPHHP